MFWILAIGLSAVAGLFVAAAARARTPDAVPEGEGALAVYRDQLTEIERDRARGLIAPAEAEAATIEVQRRMLRAARPAAGAAAATRWPVLLAALAIPLGGLALYAATGEPNRPSVSLAERAGERERASEAQATAAVLARRIADAGEAAAPEDRAALAQVLSSLARHAEAAEALDPLVQREDAPSGVITLWIEARLAATGGVMEPEIRAAVDRAIRADPLNPAASYYLSYALESEGDLAAAREVLLRRLSIEDAPPAWAAPFAQGIDRLGARLGEAPVDLAAVIGTAPPSVRRPGPAAADVEAAREMAPEARDAMIRDMVDGLAERLASAPDDAEGWLQLARARAVLGEEDAAREALERARPLVEALPDGAPARAILRDLSDRIAP